MAAQLLRFVTMSGVPIEITELKWPFHASTAGADWFVMHGRADLLESADNLHCEVAVGMTQTMKEAIGSLEPEHAESMVINAIRKTIDNGQLAFMKSGKVQPAHVTSRFYNFRARRVEFPGQPENDVLEMIKRRVFWLGRGAPTSIAHPYDCQYVNRSREEMIEMAGRLAAQGLIGLVGDQASATDALLGEEPAIRAAMQKGVEAGLAAAKITA